MAAYENIKNGAEREKKSAVFLPLREPGSKLWPDVIREVEKMKKIEDLKAKIAAAP